MKSESVIRAKLDQMQAQRANFSDPVQIRIFNAEIKRLEWVLGIGPDVVLVPKPNLAPSREISEISET